MMYMIGGNGVAKEEREPYDYYATDPKAVDYLLRIDNTGACSYAAPANGIVAYFAGIIVD